MGQPCPDRKFASARRTKCRRLALKTGSYLILVCRVSKVKTNEKSEEKNATLKMRLIPYISQDSFEFPRRSRIQDTRTYRCVI